LLTNVVPQARIAEEAGASAVMALERVPADIRSQGGVARMSDPKMIKEIMDTVTIPVMAKARIGHFVECQVRLDDFQLFCLEADPHFQHSKDPFANACG
jgi:pyridoxal biosynthesis lyase PdxS